MIRAFLPRLTVCVLRVCVGLPHSVRFARVRRVGSVHIGCHIRYNVVSRSFNARVRIMCVRVRVHVCVLCVKDT